MKKNLVWGLVALVIIVGVGYWYSTNEGKSSNKSTDDEIIVNISANLPMSGYIGIYGESVQNGLSMKLDELKDSLQENKIRINVDYQDNKGVAKDAVNIYQKQILSNPDIYMSGVTSQTMAIIDNVMKKNIPHFLWSFTPLFLDEYPNTYRTWANFGVEIDHYKNFIKANSPQRIAILYVNIIGSKIQFEDYIKPWIKEYGISSDNVLTEAYDVSTANFKDIAAKVRNFNPDILLINGFESNLIPLIKDFSTYNILDHKGNAMFSFDLLDTKDNLNNDLLEGLMCTTPYFVYSKDETIKNWKTRFTSRYNREPNYTDAFAFDLGEIIYRCSKLVKNNEVTFQNSIKDINYNGLSGKINFSESGEMNYKLNVCVFNDGELVPLKQ